MTKRKPAKEPAGTVRRKRLAFGVPKYAATKATIRRNSTESPLLRLPLEIRERIWSLVLGGGLLHLAFGQQLIYDSETEEVLRTQGEPLWSAKYCALKDSEQHSTALVPLEAVNNDRNLIAAGDEHPHRLCNATSYTFDPNVPYDDPKETTSFMNRQAKPYLQLLRTCRQIYLEASRVLWTTNTFSFKHPEDLRRFMKDRKTAQKQLLKNLRLDMAWHWELPKRQWEKALTVSLVRSLTGLRTFQLYIEQCILNRDSTVVDKADWETDILNDSFFEEIMKLKMLPLETVTVNIANGPMGPFFDDEERTPWPLARRMEWAENLKSQLLDPEGAVRWQERQEHLQELARQKKAQLVQDRANEICHRFSTEEACAELYQKRQDDKDERDGRVRKEKKVAGSCGRRHVCLVCLHSGYRKGSSDPEDAAGKCPQPGHPDDGTDMNP